MPEFKENNLSKILKPEFLTVVPSILVQVPLAVFLGNYYDQRSFLDAGYLVSAGLNPYLTNLIAVFSSNPLLTVANPVIVSRLFGPRSWDQSNVNLQHSTKYFPVQLRYQVSINR